MSAPATSGARLAVSESGTFRGRALRLDFVGSTVSVSGGVATVTGGGGGGGAALTKADDTNVTLTLGGSPATALVNAASITVGWAGTLAAGRLNSNVVQAITNDTNVTGSIVAQNLTLGWTGTLAAGRLNSNVVQSVVNDTNVTGAIAGQALTLGWTGTLAAGRLNTNVVQSIVNDTNITGSIAAQALTLAWTSTLAIGRGGTGQATKQAAFDALSPLGTQGDVLFYDGTHNVALAKNTTATRYLANTGTTNNPAWDQVNLANGVTGTLGVGNLPTNIDHHANLTNFTANDDHTQYALLVGRSGGQIVKGGTAAADTLDLRPSSAANYTGAINIGKGAGDYGGAASLLELWPDGMTFGFGASIKAVSLNSTLTHGANPAGGFPVIQLFSAAPTLAPKDTTITDFASTVAFNAQPVFQATTATNIASGLGRALQWKPIIKRTSTGTIAFSELTAVFDLPVVNTGTTVTNRYGLWFNEFSAGGGTVTTQTAVQIEALASAGTNLAIVSAGTATQTRHAGPVAIGTNTGPNTTNGNVLELVRTHTLAAGIADGQSAGLVLSPTYSGAFTVTRHDYVKVVNPAVAASAVVTAAAVFWFDADPGTHKALASPGAIGVTLGTGPTGANAGNPLGWMRINVNGNIRFVPFW